MFQMNTKTTTQ